MKKILIILLLGISLNSLTLNFKERQDLIDNIRQTIIKEELISEEIEKYIETNYSLPSLVDDLVVIDKTSLNSTYFTNFSIDTTLPDLIINYNLKAQMNDVNLISLYESNTFRDRTFFYENDKTIRVILNSDLSRHLYGLIKFNNGNIINCTEPISHKVCLVPSTKSLKVTDGTKFLYEYKIENYKSGPMFISENTTLHSNKAFDFVPNGVSFMDKDGEQYVKTDDGIVLLPQKL